MSHNFGVVWTPSGVPLMTRWCGPPQVFPAVLMAASTLGVKRIFIIGTERTDPKFWRTHLIRRDDLLSLLRQASPTAAIIFLFLSQQSRARRPSLRPPFGCRRKSVDAQVFTSF